MTDGGDAEGLRTNPHLSAGALDPYLLDTIFCVYVRITSVHYEEWKAMPYEEAPPKLIQRLYPGIPGNCVRIRRTSDDVPLMRAWLTTKEIQHVSKESWNPKALVCPA